MLRKCESVLLSRASNTPSVLPPSVGALKVGALTSEKKNKQWVKQATACSLQLHSLLFMTPPPDLPISRSLKQM